VRNGLRRLVTTVFRNPTTPVAGEATWAVGTTSAVAAVSAGVVSALLAVLNLNACGVDTGLDPVTSADSCSTVSTTFLTPTEVADVDEPVVGEGRFLTALATGPECADFDSILARVGVGS
jgi:hypothetical protein